MDDDGGTGVEAAPPGGTAALVGALEERARQAGAEGSASLLRGMLGSVAEMMHGVEHRLSRLEEALSGGTAGEGAASAVAEQVQAGLAAFNARLGRLEEAFVRALQDSEPGAGGDPDGEIGRVRAWLEEAHRRQAESLDAVGAAVEGLRATVAAGPDARGQEGGVLAAVEALGARLEDVRRQGEALSERVSSLAAALDELRRLLERHAEDTANSLGRRATEVGRRLAADLGIQRRR